MNARHDPNGGSAADSGPGRATDRPRLSRERICDAGRAQIEAVGLEGLSLREVARSLDVTAAALYAHVDGKAGLVAAVAESAFEGLAERFGEIDEADPVERIRAQCRVYVAYALEAPELYRVMMRFAPGLPDVESVGRPIPAFDPATKVFDEAMGAVADAIDQGRFIESDPLIGALTLWAATHGVIETRLMGFDLPDDMASRLVDSVIETTLRGLIAD